VIRDRAVAGPMLAVLGLAALIIGVSTMDGSDRSSPPSGGQPLAGESPASSAPPFVEVGPTPADREVAFELILAFPGRAAMNAYALAVADPASPEYRRFLDAGEVGRRFGLGDEELERVAAWARDHGLRVVSTAPQRMAMTVAAPAGAVERAFDIALHDFSDPTGRIFHAPDIDALVPPELDGLVAGVDGLDARPTERPAMAFPIAAGPAGGMTPAVIDRVYELAGLRSLGLHGEGQTVAIVSLDTYDPADVAAFDRIAGVSGPAVERVKVNGGVASPGDGQGEVNLDIDVIRAVAPKARILDYEAPNNGGAIAAVIDRIVADGRADIVSISWGSCELNRTSTAMARMATSLAAAAAAGITVFVASGDHGAYDCVDQDRTDLSVSVDSPASDVNVIGVGGTYLTMLEDGTVIDEVAWEEPLTGWAPGGGLSTVYPRPAWQRGAGVDNDESNGMRQVPDVAAAADPSSGFLTVSEGEASSGGGTSAAAPFWAALTVLTRQLGQQQGVDGLGSIGPALYAIAAAQPAGSVFRDVTRGGNLLDDAAPGWDYATGLGLPRGTALARAVVAYAKGAR
jgi:subtilase family serine protease